MAKAHGIDPEAILEEGDRISITEVQRAKHQFRYLVSEALGLRAAARFLGCSSGTIFYARKAHKKKYKADFYYTELFNLSEKYLNK